jgi:hypothetical protein
MVFYILNTKHLDNYFVLIDVLLYNLQIFMLLFYLFVNVHFRIFIRFGRVSLGIIHGLDLYLLELS